MSQKDKVIVKLGIKKIQRLYAIRDEVLEGKYGTDSQKNNIPKLYRKKLRDEGSNFNPWNVRGVLTLTAEQARKEGLSKRISRQTVRHYANIYSKDAPIQEERACTVKSTDMPKGIWIKQSDYEKLKEAFSQLQKVQKKFEGFKTYFEGSLVINLKEFRVRHHLQGLTAEDFILSFRKQTELDEPHTDNMKKMFDNTLKEFNHAIGNLVTLSF